MPYELQLDVFSTFHRLLLATKDASSPKCVIFRRRGYFARFSFLF